MFGVEVQHDQERGTQGFFEARYTLPFGGSKRWRLNPIEQRMVDRVVRDVDIVTNTNEIFTDSLATTTPNGSVVKHITYVSGNSGNDANDGTIESPVKTIQEGVDKGLDGQTVYVFSADNDYVGDGDVMLAETVAAVVDIAWVKGREPL